ncbi:MAG TPA: hypothetical protein VLM17_09465 [Xanthomonadaceae bacterium]|nr:hypothetical protein [Xanthomonadaceae bacterium]
MFSAFAFVPFALCAVLLRVPGAVAEIAILAVAVVHFGSPLVDPIQGVMRPARPHPQHVAGGGLQVLGGGGSGVVVLHGRVLAVVTAMAFL